MRSAEPPPSVSVAHGEALPPPPPASAIDAFDALMPSRRLHISVTALLTLSLRDLPTIIEAASSSLLLLPAGVPVDGVPVVLLRFASRKHLRCCCAFDDDDVFVMAGVVLLDAALVIEGAAAATMATVVVRAAAAAAVVVRLGGGGGTFLAAAAATAFVVVAAVVVGGNLVDAAGRLLTEER